MKKIVAIVAAFMLASPTPLAAEEPYGHDEAAIVKVLCAFGSGSAVRIGRNEYISVAHVTDMSGCTVDGTPIIVTHTDKEKDFSTFLGPAGMATMRVSCEGYKAGKTYIARGYAFGGGDVWFQPLLAVTKVPGRDMMAFVGEVYPGMSGGPMIDSKGRVTGTVNIRNPSGSVDLKHTPVCER